MNGTLWIEAAMAAHAAAAVAVSLHAARIKRESNTALLWILIAWSFPFVGAFVYLVFGIDRIAVKSELRVRKHDAFLDARRARAEESLPMAYWQGVRAGGVVEPDGDWAKALNRSMDPVLPDFPMVGGNRVEVLVGGEEAFPPMMEAIRAARDHVHVQTFILGADPVGRQFMDLLLEKAREGVVVRFLYDRLGSTPAVWSGFVGRYRRVHPNLRIAGWTQANPLRRQFQFNLRNHRKILVADGRVAFTGGINLQDVNVTRPGRSADRDLHFRLEGPAVQELQFSFLSDWHFMTDEPPDALLCRACFPGAARAGKAQVRVVNGGPSLEMETLPDVIFNLLVAARRQIVAVTPYFVPTPDILRAFRSAALRGVEVKLVVPERNNHPYAGFAGQARYEALLDAGVRVFERRPPFMHAKALIVDDEVALVGSANLDARSLRLNYETNLAVFDAEFIGRLKQAVLAEMGASRELSADLWRRRPAWRRFVEDLCSLLSPVL